MYYVLNSCLYIDRATRIIAYPYYAKYTRPGNNTKFLYININIP